MARLQEMNTIARKKDGRHEYPLENKRRFPWGWLFGGAAIFFFMIFFLIIIGMIALIFGGGTAETGTGNVAVIPIKGVIMTGDSGILFSEENAVSGEITDMITDAEEDSDIKAIIIEIDSPGGSAVASDEIAQALKKTEKPTVALIREVGASGAYWAASACDVIVANRMSVVGSIGVIGSYIDFSGFMTRYNLSYERLVAGEYKDMGTPYRKLSDSEREIIHGQLDLMHEIFILDVAENRNISVDRLKKLANGLYYIGADGKKNGLVDILGGEDEAIAYIEETAGIEAGLVYYQKSLSFFELLSMSAQERYYSLGQGIGDSLSRNMENAGYASLK